MYELVGKSAKPASHLPPVARDNELELEKSPTDNPDDVEQQQDSDLETVEPDDQRTERKKIIENYAQIKRYQYSAQQLSKNLASDDALIAASALANIMIGTSATAINYGLGMVTPPIPGLPEMLTGISGTIMGDLTNRALSAIGSRDLNTTLFSGQKTQLLAAALPNAIEYGLAVAHSNSIPLGPSSIKGFFIDEQIDNARALIWAKGAVAQKAYHAADVALRVVKHLESETRELFEKLGEESASSIKLNPSDYVLNTVAGYDTPKFIKLRKTLTAESLTNSASSAKEALHQLSRTAKEIGYPAISWGERQGEMGKHNKRIPLAYWSEGDIELKYPFIETPNNSQ